MRILGACIFVSFLAGKLRHFNRMLLTKFQKLGICVFLSTRIFWWENKVLKRILTRKVSMKKFDEQ